MNAIINYKAPRRGLVAFFYNYPATAYAPGMGAGAQPPRPQGQRAEAGAPHAPISNGGDVGMPKADEL